MEHCVEVMWWTLLFFPVEIILPLLYQVADFGFLYAYKIPPLSKTLNDDITHAFKISKYTFTGTP